MKRRLVLTTALLAPSWAWAHEPRVGPHGGTLVDAGSYHIEISLKGTLVEVYISDTADRPVPAAGFKGTAILAIDGTSHRIVLAPVNGNLLIGQSPVSSNDPPKGAVLLIAPDGKTAQAKLN